MGSINTGEMKYLIFSFLRSGAEEKSGVEFWKQHVMPPEFGGKWGTECFNTRFGR